MVSKLGKNKRNWESELAPLLSAAVGDGLRRPEDAWITMDEDAEAHYGDGHVYVLRYSPDNPEHTVAQIRPSMMLSIRDGLCVKIEPIPATEQGVAWELTDFGTRSFEQHGGQYPNVQMSVHSHQSDSQGGQLNATTVFSAGNVPKARQAADTVYTDDVQTLTNKTLTTPTIASLTNAQHTHANAAGGGQLNATNVFSAGNVPKARQATDTVYTGDAQTLTSKTLTSPIINGATINTSTIGQTTAAAGRFTALALNAATELTIATGAVTVTQSYHRIDTEADAASDDLDTINGGSATLNRLVIRAENTARTVVLTTAGNILTPDGNSLTLDEVYKMIELVWDATLSKWVVIFGGGGGGGAIDFTDLGDTPSAYTGHANKVVAVNAGETALEFIAKTAALDINGLTTEAAPVAGDFLAMYDVSATANRKIDLSNLPFANKTLSNLTDPTLINTSLLPDGDGYSLGDVVSGSWEFAYINYLIMKEVAAPSTPAAGRANLYFKTDGRLYYKDDTGTELGPLGTVYAPTSEQYVTGAASANLSAEIAIPGIRANPDRSGAAGAGTSEEYDTTTTGLTWTPSTPTVNSNTTFASHLYASAADTTERYGYKSWSPAGAFDARCKMSIQSLNTSGSKSVGLMVANSGNTSIAFIQLMQNTAANGIEIGAYTYSGGVYTQQGSWVSYGPNSAYLSITRGASNDVYFLWSTDGLAWVLIASLTFTFTVARIGYRMTSSAAVGYAMVVDWLRTSV